MNQQMHFLVRSGLALAFALAIWSPVQSQSAEPAKGTEMTAAQMKERCQAMKEQKKKLQEDIAAENAQLTAQVNEMNNAPQDKKVDLMAAVVTHIVEQRSARDARKAKMEEEMMQHMMEHRMGKGPMPDCPMMEGMRHMDDKPGGPHREHHAEQK